MALLGAQLLRDLHADAVVPDRRLRTRLSVDGIDADLPRALSIAVGIGPAHATHDAHRRGRPVTGLGQPRFLDRQLGSGAAVHTGRDLRGERGAHLGILEVTLRAAVCGPLDLSANDKITPDARLKRDEGCSLCLALADAFSDQRNREVERTLRLHRAFELQSFALLVAASAELHLTVDLQLCRPIHRREERGRRRARRRPDDPAARADLEACGGKSLGLAITRLLHLNAPAHPESLAIVATGSHSTAAAVATSTAAATTAAAPTSTATTVRTGAYRNSRGVTRSQFSALERVLHPAAAPARPSACRGTRQPIRHHRRPTRSTAPAHTPDRHRNDQRTLRRQCPRTPSSRG